MNKVVIEIPALWWHIVDELPEKLSERSINSWSSKAGILGELAVVQYFNAEGIDYEYVAQDDFSCDLICNGRKVDVKTTERRGFASDFNNALLTDYQKEQDCDTYIFASIPKDKGLVEIVGYCDKKWFWSNNYARDLEAGEKVAVTAVKEPCRILKYGYLADIYQIGSVLRDYH
jgi:hypothetical protein